MVVRWRRRRRRGRRDGKRGRVVRTINACMRDDDDIDDKRSWRQLVWLFLFSVF